MSNMFKHRRVCIEDGDIDFTGPLRMAAVQDGRAAECIRSALRKCPSLGVYGVGNPGGGLIVDPGDFLSEVEYCIRWIGHQKLTKNVTSRGSYSYKHIVEKWAGEYIPNGAFIAAAVGLGLKFSSYGPNASFNISRRIKNPPVRAAACN